jgi:hypothetical protein
MLVHIVRQLLQLPLKPLLPVEGGIFILMRKKRMKNLIPDALDPALAINAGHVFSAPECP